MRSEDSGDRSPQGIRAALDALCDGDPEEHLALGEIANGLGPSAFGVLLLIASLPAFIPIPGVAGVLSGPPAMLIGLHLLFLRSQLWLPAFLSRRGPQRHTVIRFDRVSDRWLQRSARFVRPRLPGMIDHPLARVFTGLLLALLGGLLALPIPGTNFLLGFQLFVFALALLERDGMLMLVSWISGAAFVVVLAAMSKNLVALLWAWVASLG